MKSLGQRCLLNQIQDYLAQKHEVTGNVIEVVPIMRSICKLDCPLYAMSGTKDKDFFFLEFDQH